MKKEPATNDKKILKFLLEQQLPDAHVAGLGRDGKSLPAAAGSPVASSSDDAILITAVDHVTQVALETCRCVHLQEHLPHLLDLELCKAVHHPRGWLVAHPVHSLHLQSQLEDSVPPVAHNRQPPVLYGEEQQRTMALNTEGIVEYWCPLDGYSAVIHDDTAVEKMEHMPTLHSIHKAWAPGSNNVSVRHLSSLPLPPPSSSRAVSATSSAVAVAHPSKIPGAPHLTNNNNNNNNNNTSSGVLAPSVSSSSTTVSDYSATVPPTDTSKSEATKSAVETLAAPISPEKVAQDKDTTKEQSDEKDKEEGSPPESSSHKEETKDITTQPEVVPSKDTLLEDVVSSMPEEPVSSSTPMDVDVDDAAAPDKPAPATVSEKKEEETSSSSSSPIKAERETSDTPNANEEETEESKPAPTTDAVDTTTGSTDEADKSNVSLGNPSDKHGDDSEKHVDRDAPSTKDEKDAGGEDEVEDSKAEEKTEDSAKAVDEAGVKEEVEAKTEESPVEASKDESKEGSSKDAEGVNDESEDPKPKESETPKEESSKENKVSKDGSDAQVAMEKDEPLPEAPKKDDEQTKDDSEVKQGAESKIESVKIESDPPKNDAQEQNAAAEKQNEPPTEPKRDASTEKEGQVDDMEVDKVATTTEGTKAVGGGEAPTPVTSSHSAVASASVSTPSTPAIPAASALVPAPVSFRLQPGEEIPLSLPEEIFNHLRIEEDRIRLIRRSLSSHRILPKKKVDPKKRVFVDPKKKRKRDEFYKAPGIPGWHASNQKEVTQEQEDQWLEAMSASRVKVERWMDSFRLCRETFWDERERQASPAKQTDHGDFYLPREHDVATQMRCCETCTARPQGDIYWDGNSKKAQKPRRNLCGDDLMQCLECNFVGCSPQSIARDSKQHILEHLLISGHKFAVSCGERGQLFCFCCGDFVYHEVFEQEKARIDYSKTVPLMAWKPHKLYRSFDPFHFIKTQDHGIVWRGLIATYPQLVPSEHVRATEATSRRQALFNGEVEEEWLANKPFALTFAASQSLLDAATKHRIRTPVGMYNLGNTCYKSAVLQCLVHCQPLQRFFLKENGHHHNACRLYRQREASKRKKKKTAIKPEESICLACEMDKLYLSYYGSTIGFDVRGAVEEACDRESSDAEMDEALERGDPLVISEMLTASWKSGGMNSLASYKQHDSHEFMNSFLEMVGRQTKLHWARVHSAINSVRSDNAVVGDATENEHDIVKTLFEGSLSSVLLCEECGTKRKRTEEFLNVSLSLSEEVARMQSANGPKKSELSVETCLERFVMPEKLGDSVSCPSCARKTSTQKQHTFGTLPKVLCLHLKRFDAALNKKIDDFVSFPARGLNMGKYLAQWCEVTSLRSSEEASGVAEPQVYYDLFGTVNHVGNMQSGHYVTNVKVDDQWYHFNDAHVSLAGGEQSVVKNAGAYILFYVRR